MITENKLKIYTSKDIDNNSSAQYSFGSSKNLNIKVVASVFPFRTNNYVVEELIDWTKVPNDPIFQLTFLQKEYVKTIINLNRLAEVIRNRSSKRGIK